jgi:hypothetical protein
MNDVEGRQAIAARDLGRAGFAAVERFAFLQQLRACGTMDRAVDPAAAEQRRVRRIDDGVDRERGDVGDDDIQSRRSGSAVRSGDCIPSI